MERSPACADPASAPAEAVKAPIEITFTDAYDRLKTITEKLNSSEALPPEELLDLLQTGKGLERVLRAHLDQVEQQVKEIESGDAYVPFRIVPTAPAGAQTPAAGEHAVPARGASGAARASDPARAADAEDELPF